MMMRNSTKCLPNPAMMAGFFFDKKIAPIVVGVIFDFEANFELYLEFSWTRKFKVFSIVRRFLMSWRTLGFFKLSRASLDFL